MRSRFPLFAVAATLALAACDGAAGPEPLAGIYLAQTVDGRPVPAVLDSVPWNDGSTVTVFRLTAASVEFIDRENARYTVSERAVAYRQSDSIPGGSCMSIVVPYRRDAGRVVLVVEPALYGGSGRLHLDTLHVQNDELVQTITAPTGKPATVRYARRTRGAEC